MLHINLDRTPKHCPYHLQIIEQVRSLIMTTQLTKGERLPPSRQLASELNISRRTVVLAYEELCEQGYCEGKVGSGTVVAKPLTLQTEANINSVQGIPSWLCLGNSSSSNTDQDKDRIHFAPSLSQIDFLPVREMQRTLRSVADQAISKLGRYEKNNGSLDLIQLLCQQILPTRGIRAEPDHVLITNGSHHSSFLISMLVCPYGGSITYGVPGYLTIPHNFVVGGMKGIPCSIDSEGVCLSGDAQYARVHYVMPEHHFPEGITLSPNRRETLLCLAENQDALIIEDDYDSEFYYERHPLPSLKSRDAGGRVIYMGTFSKLLFNGLRLGYVVAHPDIVRRLVDIRWQLDGGTSLVLQLWVKELLESGAVERHLRRMRCHYQKKRNLIATYLKELFPNWHWRLPTGGTQFWIDLPIGQSASMVVLRAQEQGVVIESGADYYIKKDKEADRHLIIGFGAVTESEIHQAFNMLRATGGGFQAAIEKET